MAETGHHASRVFIDQDGNFNLNGAAFKNDADADVSDSFENLGNMMIASATGMRLICGSSANSSLGINTITHGLGAIVAGFANVRSTAAILSTAGAPVQAAVQISGSTFQVTLFKFTSTSDPSLIIATSTAYNFSWMVVGTT